MGGFSVMCVRANANCTMGNGDCVSCGPGGATNCRDARGDDEIEIRIDATGAVTGRYVTMSTTDCGCPALNEKTAPLATDSTS